MILRIHLGFKVYIVGIRKVVQIRKLMLFRPKCSGQYNFYKPTPSQENFPTVVNMNGSLGNTTNLLELFCAYMDGHTKMENSEFGG